MSNSSPSTLNVSGIFVPLLTVLFIGLKLTGHITWSWLWVLAPMWITAAIFALIAAVLVVLHCLK